MKHKKKFKQKTNKERKKVNINCMKTEKIKISYNKRKFINYKKKLNKKENK